LPPSNELTAPLQVALLARPEREPSDEPDGGKRRKCTPSGRHPTGLPRGLSHLYEFFSSWRFPVLTLGVMLSVELFQVLMLFLPASESGVGAFAEEFRVWCYGLDVDKGGMEWGYVFMFLAQPAVLSLVLAGIWKTPIQQVFRSSPRQTLPYLAASAILVSAVLVSLVSLGAPQQAKAAFPAVALRMDKDAHPVDLVNQDGARVTLDSLRGHVVVLTGVYATCGHTCPLIMGQIRRAVAKLAEPERAQVRVLAVTLNPEYDTTPVLKLASVRYQAPTPTYHFLGGDSGRVNEILDAYEIARKMNHDTKQIDHANLFIVLDKRGKVAYRLTLGEQQEQWLTAAMRLLARET
jgi:protein SCO1/2